MTPRSPQRAPRRRPWLVFAAAASPFAGCALANENHRCATDRDCLAGHECRSGVCTSSHATGESGTNGVGGAEPNRDLAMAGSGMAGSGGGGAEQTLGGGTSIGGAGQSSKDPGGSTGRGGSLAAAGGTGARGGATQGPGGTAGDGAGHGGEAGVAGDTSTTEPQCDPMLENIQQECSGQFSPVYYLADARAVAVSAQTAHGYVVYASETGDSDAIASSWCGYPGQSFSSMYCFDALPTVTRMAGTTMLDDALEVFAVGRCGTLWERHVQFGGWVNWIELYEPAVASRVSDIAATRVAGKTNFIFVADRGNVFVRHRTEPEPEAPFGEWSLINKGAGNVIAAATRSDGRQQIFTLDGSGKPRTSIQQTSDLDSGFGKFTDFDSSTVPALIDIEAVDGLPQLEVYGLDIGGGLWMRREDGQGSFTPWDGGATPAPVVAFTTIAGAGIYGLTDGTMALIGSSSSGAYVNQRMNGVWLGWTHL